jgi:hypothetical protein
MTIPNASPSGPKKPRSPWVWVGLGCGTAILLTFGGCVAFLGLVGQRAAQEMGKPLDRKEVLAKLGDTPIYQPSTFNETMTKGARIGSSLFPGQMMSAAAFNTGDTPKQIITWYEQQLSSKGYQKLSEQPSLNRESTQVQFQKQSDGIIVQVQEATATSPKGYTFLLMRMRLPTAKPSP